MPTTDVRIINQALSHLGHTIFIQHRNGAGLEVEVANIHYDDAVDYVLEDFAWGFAKRFMELALVENEPVGHWAYAYRYPVSAVKIRRIVTALGPRETNPPPYEIGGDDTGRLIYTNCEEAVVEVTKRITSTSMFPAQFAEAVSWWLAFLMVPGLAKDPGIAGGLIKMYTTIVVQAAAHDGNEGQSYPPEESEFIRARA